MTVIPADLVTPLGAYLRLRDPGSGSFLLESVERGRLGRTSFVAGVVADSSPEAEHRECLAKLAALEVAVELAEKEYA